MVLCIKVEACENYLNKWQMCLSTFSCAIKDWHLSYYSDSQNFTKVLWSLCWLRIFAGPEITSQGAEKSVGFAQHRGWSPYPVPLPASYQSPSLSTQKELHLSQLQATLKGWPLWPFFEFSSCKAEWTACFNQQGVTVLQDTLSSIWTLLQWLYLIRAHLKIIQMRDRAVQKSNLLKAHKRIF